MAGAEHLEDGRSVLSGCVGASDFVAYAGGVCSADDGESFEVLVEAAGKACLFVGGERSSGVRYAAFEAPFG